MTTAPVRPAQPRYPPPVAAKAVYSAWRYGDPQRNEPPLVRVGVAVVKQAAETRKERRE